MKVWSDKHQVIMGGSTSPSLADAATLAAPDGVSLPTTLVMAQGGHTRLSVVLSTLFGTNHPTTLAMTEVNVKIMERETEIEEYNPRDRGLKAYLLASITCWV